MSLSILIPALLIICLSLAVFAVYSFIKMKWLQAGAAGASLFLIMVLIVVFKPWGYVDYHELGYIFDSRNGKVTVLEHPGYYSRVPLFQNIHTVDLRPRQVCITVGNSNSDSANTRVLNCKLVSFNPLGLKQFISWHGRGDYNGSLLNDLLKIYAYDSTGKTYPFLTISTELKDADQKPLEVVE